MKFKCRLLFLLIVGLSVYSSLFAAEEQWLVQATLGLNATGTMRSFVPPELHHSTRAGALDLSLLGPDQNRRACELFWRETGEVAPMLLKPDKVELHDDKRLMWEAGLPEKLLLTSLKVHLPAFLPAARVSFIGVNGDETETLGENIAVIKPAPMASTGQAEIKVAEKAFEKIRIYFTGFDENFNQTPIQTMMVLATGRRDGSDYFVQTRELEFEEVARNQELEIRLRLPGTGIMVEALEIETEAMFQGEWRLGSEKIVLGQGEFSLWRSGRISGVSEKPLSFAAAVDRKCQESTLVLILKSENYFGHIKSVKASLRLPYLKFAADQPGDYRLLAGTSQVQQIAELPSDDSSPAEFQVSFSRIEKNEKQAAEAILSDFAIAGGPFKSQGYTWKATFKIEKPGFYQLQLGPKASMKGQLSGLRIVYQDQQIPYFSGRLRERSQPVKFAEEFDQNQNRSIYTLEFPGDLNLPEYLKLRTSGIFSRQVQIFKHEAGKVGWQLWRTLSWKNDENRETEFYLDLQGMPEDQKELRLVIDNGSNQAIKISEINGWYRTSDLYFVAGKTGEYSLYGGNTAAGPARYDLAIVQNRLLGLFPEKISHGELVQLEIASDNTLPDKGGPFNAAGYTWVASISVAVPGLTQVGLNQAASLDAYREGIRIVKNGYQIPYFAGEKFQRRLKIEISNNYDRDKNKSIIDLKLPLASKFWRALEFTVPGVFSRKVELQLRKPGKLGWKKWKSFNWVGSDVEKNSFVIALNDLPEGETELRLDIAHGDNSPLVFTGAAALFETRDLFFDAAEAGEYLIYGGNSSAKAPAYDIALIRNSLLKTEPKKVEMSDAAAHSQTEITRQLEEVFSERGYGLYLVLGLVTVVLLVLIVKMFPEEADQPEKEEAGATARQQGNQENSEEKNEANDEKGQ